MNDVSVFALGFAVVVIAVVVIFTFVRRFKRCPSDKIMVIFGKVGRGLDGESRSAKCIHGGAAFIWPLIQEAKFLDLTPFSLNVDLKNALSRQNIRINVPSSFTVGISTEPGVMQNAAERLLDLPPSAIINLAGEIIFGQLRLIIATMDIEELNTQRDKFMAAVSMNVENELQKIGLKLINANITDIKDESDYIVALGKEAEAKAVNEAKKNVAERELEGNTGQKAAKAMEAIIIAKKDQEQREGVANANAAAIAAEKDAEQAQRVAIANANANAIKGENSAAAAIAISEATRREAEANARSRAVSAEKVQAAKALEEAYAAEERAEKARAALEKATLEANVLVKAQIEKTRIEIQAEAEAETIRRKAKGTADAVFLKMQAEANGLKEILSKQSEGFERLIQSANGDPNAAMRLLMTDKVESLLQTQVEAIKNINIDKITVWDSMSGEGGASTTSQFLNSIMRSLPPMKDVYNMVGIDMPMQDKKNLSLDKKE